MRRPKNVDDAEGKVRVVIMLVGSKHCAVKGNIVRVVTVQKSRVSEVAARVKRSAFRVIGGIEKKVVV